MNKIKARLDITAEQPVLVDLRLCDQCGACIGICPADCINLNEFSLSIIGSECIKCGFCLPACPVTALSWNEGDQAENSTVADLKNVVDGD